MPAARLLIAAKNVAVRPKIVWSAAEFFDYQIVESSNRRSTPRGGEKETERHNFRCSSIELKIVFYPKIGIPIRAGVGEFLNGTPLFCGRIGGEVLSAEDVRSNGKFHVISVGSVHRTLHVH